MPPMYCSSSRVMRIITGAFAFFDSSAGIVHDTAPVALLPKPPPVYSADEHDVGRLEPHPARDRRHGLHRALRAGVHVQLAVAPVGQRRARLQRVVLVVGDRERLVEHERRVLEPGFDIAVRPFHLRLAHRHPPLVVFGEVLRRPFQRLDHQRAGRLTGRRRRAAPGVALDARVRPVRPQALERIDDEGQMLEVDVDRLDGRRGGLFVDGGDGQHGLAGVDRLVGQRPLAIGLARMVSPRSVTVSAGAGIRLAVRIALHAGHRHRGARVDAPHASMRNRAEQQLREEHAVGAEILGVFRSARDLGHEIRRDVVLTDEFRIVSHGPPPATAPHRDGAP